MYAALWRILLALAAIVLAALVQWVFPWVADTLLPQESTVGS